MTEQNYLFVTGRLVQGDVFTPQTKNMTGGPLTDLQGNPKVQYFIAVAVEKTDATMTQTFAQIQQIAQSGFPGGEAQRPDFAWKVIDGDDPKHAGKTGFAGCMVFRFTSGFPVKAYTKGAASQIVDPNQIKRGYFVRVAFTVAPNGNATKPGVYLNLALVELVGYGEEILSGPDAASVLGAAGVAAVPAGASTAPVTGAPPIFPGVPAPTGPPITPGAPAPTGPQAPGLYTPPVSMTTTPVTQRPAPTPPGVIVPAPDFLNPPVMTAKAAGASYQQFIDQGWTKEQLIEQGYVAP